MRRCRRCRATNSLNAKLAGKARCSLPLSIKQGGLKEAELKSLILEQYQAAGIAPESVDSGAIIITGESAKTRNARPAVMALSQSLAILSSPAPGRTSNP